MRLFFLLKTMTIQVWLIAFKFVWTRYGTTYVLTMWQPRTVVVWTSVPTVTEIWIDNLDDHRLYRWNYFYRVHEIYARPNPYGLWYTCDFILLIFDCKLKKISIPNDIFSKLKPVYKYVYEFIFFSVKIIYWDIPMEYLNWFTCKPIHTHFPDRYFWGNKHSPKWCTLWQPTP